MPKFFVGRINIGLKAENDSGRDELFNPLTAGAAYIRFLIFY